MTEYQVIIDQAKARRKHYRQLLNKLGKQKNLQVLQNAHDVTFQSIDCLKCGACCKGYSPRFSTTDIKRISKLLGMKESHFIETYLKLDEEDDFVLQQSPCAFLGTVNRCAIYESRPKDCRRFPYTNEDVLFKKPSLSMKNLGICPAISRVLDKINERL